MRADRDEYIASLSSSSFYRVLREEKHEPADGGASLQGASILRR
jgi:hypothetical protein